MHINLFRPLVENGKNPQKYIRYTPEELERLLGEFFEGKTWAEPKRWGPAKPKKKNHFCSLWFNLVYFGIWFNKWLPINKLFCLYSFISCSICQLAWHLIKQKRSIFRVVFFFWISLLFSFLSFPCGFVYFAQALNETNLVWWNNN